MNGLRLIPAGAGSTQLVEQNERRLWAHPRWRGEHGLVKRLLRRGSGSSPLARGAPPLRVFVAECAGLIPAGAGSTRRPASRRSGIRAHPRWRGEHGEAAPAAMDDLGSSPLARGAHGRHNEENRVGGLIPAGAGSTSPACAAALRHPAHPRWRGEHDQSTRITTV